VIVRKMALATALAGALVGFAPQTSHATLVPRVVFAEELGWFT
jgi:hypothetical protein